MVGGVALLVFGACAWIGVARSLREIRRQVAENRRIADLRLHGARVRGTVVDVRFQNLWQENEALFDVTAEYSTPSGTRRLTQTLHVPVAAAPVVGGTVVIRFHGDGSDTDDVLMIEDADSIRDPESFAKYGGPPSP